MFRSVINLLPKNRVNGFLPRGRPINNINTSQQDDLKKKVANNPPSPPKKSLNDLD